MISLCKMFSSSQCSKEIHELRRNAANLERERNSFKCALDVQLGTIQELKATYDYKMVEVEQEIERLNKLNAEYENNLVCAAHKISNQGHDLSVVMKECEDLLEEIAMKPAIKSTKVKAKKGKTNE